MSGVREYVSARRSATGKTVVTVSLVDGTLSAKWSLAAAVTDLKPTVHMARKYAQTALQQLREATEES